MALTKAQVREILSGAGVDSEHMSAAVDKIIDGHVASVNALREEADGFKADAAKLKDIQKELDDLKAKTEADAKEREGKDYDALKAEFDKYKSDTEAEKKAAATEGKFRELLKDMNISEAGIAKIMKWQGVNGVELDDAGKITNAKDLRKAIREDWPEYITTETVVGATTANPPANTGGTSKSREDILGIKDDAEMVRAIEANPAAFGIT